jgi:hypothetical protein
MTLMTCVKLGEAFRVMYTKSRFLIHVPKSCTQNRTFLYMSFREQFKLERNVKHNLEPISAKPSHKFKLERKALTNNKNLNQHLEKMGLTWN